MPIAIFYNFLLFLTIIIYHILYLHDLSSIFEYAVTFNLVFVIIFTFTRNVTELTFHIQCCVSWLWWFVVVCSSTLYRLCVVCSVSCYNDGGCICSLYASDICRTQVPGYGRSRDSITVDYTLDYFLDAFSYCQWIVTRNQGNIMNIYCGI